MLVVGHLVVFNIGPCNKTGGARAKWHLDFGLVLFDENPIDWKSVCLFIVN